jgi:hypothetical protein
VAAGGLEVGLKMEGQPEVGAGRKLCPCFQLCQGKGQGNSEWRA